MSDTCFFHDAWDEANANCCSLPDGILPEKNESTSSAAMTRSPSAGGSVAGTGGGAGDDDEVVKLSREDGPVLRSHGGVTTTTVDPSSFGVMTGTHCQKFKSRKFIQVLEIIEITMMTGLRLFE